MTDKDFGKELTKHEKSLKGFALKLTRDYDDANDLLQETFVKAIRNKDKFQEGTNLGAWLYTIMKNAFISNYQRMTRIQTFIDTTDNLYHLNHSSARVSNDGIQLLQSKELENVMDSIEDKFRIPFLMYFRGFKYHEIANRLNLPLGTIKNRIHVARQTMMTKVDIQEGVYN